MRRNFYRIAFFMALIFSSNKGFSQFSAGLKYTTTSMELSDLYNDNFISELYYLNLNSSGVGPSFNMDSKRFMFQSYIAKHFTGYGSNFQGTSDFISQKRKPSEMGVSVGYKINANKEIKIIPIVSASRYNILFETEIRDNNETLTLRERHSATRVGGGIMGQYYYKNLVFDMQAKLQSSFIDIGDFYFTGLNFSVDLGISYNFGWDNNTTQAPVE